MVLMFILLPLLRLVLTKFGPWLVSLCIRTNCKKSLPHKVLLTYIKLFKHLRAKQGGQAASQICITFGVFFTFCLSTQPACLAGNHPTYGGAIHNPQTTSDCKRPTREGTFWDVQGSGFRTILQTWQEMQPLPKTLKFCIWVKQF